MRIGGFLKKKKYKFHGFVGPLGAVFEKNNCKTKNVTFWRSLVIPFWYRIQNLRKKLVRLVSRTCSKTLSASSSGSSKVNKEFWCECCILLFWTHTFGIWSYWYLVLLVFDLVGIRSYWYLWVCGLWFVGLLFCWLAGLWVVCFLKEVSKNWCLNSVQNDA